LTVEVKNTDAEGRLVLADAMSWTQRNNPELVDLIELSTLTGACVVALGDRNSGLFSNDDPLATSISQAGSTVQEGFWRIPIFEEQQEATKGVHSDLVSIGAGRYGGHIFAAAFLEKFVNKGVKWAHLDIAGPAMAAKPFSVYSAGCTGFGVGTLLELHKKAVIN
jgi:leucyl aminopeptidase